METLSLGERLVAGLQDILLNRITCVDSLQALSAHLGEVLNEA